MSKTHGIDGVIYVEVERKAEVGDKIHVVKPFATGGLYSKGDILTAIERYSYGENTKGVYVNGIGIGIRDEEYRVLEQLQSEEVTVDTSQASEQVIEMFAALSRKIVSLERQLADTQRNLETFAEQTENNSEDIRTLDARTQVINAITKFYEEGSR